MPSKLVDFGKFCLRVMPEWHAVPPKPDSEFDLMLRTHLDATELFIVSLIPASDEKVFTNAQGKRLCHAPELLLRLAARAATLSGCFEPFDHEMYQKKMTWGAVSFRSGQHFLRQWYIAGDRAIASISYQRPWDDLSTSADSCLPMVQSFRWNL
jgi:hypothetical protein